MKKKLILIIITTILSISIFAQVQTDPNLDLFVGTWRWTSGNDTVILVLQKQVNGTTPQSGLTEMIVGWQKYVKNGQLVVSNLQEVGTNATNSFLTQDGKRHFVGGSNGPNKLLLFGVDLLIDKSEDLRFNLLSGSTTQAEWKLSNGRGLYTGAAGTESQITLPRNLILTKQ